MPPEVGPHRRRDENLLFIKRAIRNPKALGAIMPSSRQLARFIARHLEREDSEYIVEVGAGTGRFTDTFIKSGVPPEKLIVVELDKELANYLKRRFPKVLIIHGDASQLSQILPEEVVGRVRTIVSGIPMVNLSRQQQISIVSSCFSVISDNGKLLQFTYTPISPIPSRVLQLTSKMIGYVFLNLPPANIWSYRRLANTVVVPKKAFSELVKHQFRQMRLKIKR